MYPPKTEQKESRGKAILLTLSIGLSFTLWFVNQLGRDYQTVLTFSYRITNIPSNISIENRYANLSFLVKGKGTNLFWKKISPYHDTLQLRYHHYFHLGYILPKQHKEDFRAVPNDIQLLYALPDTLKIRVFSNEWMKKVSVKPDLQFNLHPTVRLFKPISISPDSVTVYASSAAQINSLAWIETEQITTPEMEDSTVFYVPIKKGSLQVVPEVVTITAIPEKYTTIQPEIPIIINDIPNGITIKLNPPALKPQCIIPLKQYEQSQNIKMEWRISYNSLKEGVPLIPNYDFLPDYIQVVPPYESEVSFIIQSESP